MSNQVEKASSWEELVALSPEPPQKRGENAKTEDVFLGTGTVMGASDASITVRVGDTAVRAARATSCLVSPEPGDHVLVAMPEGECYVLAVLRREAGAKCKIASDGDLEIAAPKGRVVVAAGQGIDLLTPKETSVIAGRLSLHAADVVAVLDKLAYVGESVRAEVGKLRVVASELDGFFERTMTRVKRSYRFVEQIEQVRAKQVDIVAETSVRVHAEATVVTANGLCKIDGTQVHIG